MAGTWSAAADAALQTAVFSTAFDFNAVQKVLESFIRVTPDQCRMRFAELQGGGEHSLESIPGEDDLDIDSLLLGEDEDYGVGGLDYAALRNGRADSLGASHVSIASGARGPLATSNNRSTLLLDASAFDFDADAALAEADAHIGAAIDAAMLAKIRSASGGALPAEASRVPNSVLPTPDVRATSAPAVSEFNAGEELARIEARSASRSAARLVAQTAMFDRVLGALGGPLDAAAAHALPVHLPVGTALPAQNRAGGASTSAMDGPGGGAIAIEDEEDIAAFAVLERATAVFRAVTTPGGVSTSGAGPAVGVVGGDDEDVEPYVPSSVNSMFKGHDSDLTLAAWDVLLRDVRLPGEGGEGGAAATGSSTMAATAAGSSGRTTCQGEAEGEDAVPDPSSMSSVLAFLAGEAQKAKVQPPLRATRTPGKQVRAALPPPVTTAPPTAPIAASPPFAPPAAALVRDLQSARDSSRLGAPVGSRSGRAHNRYASEGYGQHVEEGEEVEEEVDIRAKRAALKAQGAQAAASGPAPPRKEPHESEEGPSHLMQLLRAGRAAAGVRALPMEEAIGREDEDEDIDVAPSLPSRSFVASTVGPALVSTETLVSDTVELGDGGMDAKESIGAHIARSAMSVAGLLATVGAVSEAMLRAGAVEGAEASGPHDDVPDVGSYGVPRATSASRRAWVHGSAAPPLPSLAPMPAKALPAASPIKKSDGTASVTPTLEKGAAQQGEEASDGVVDIDDDDEGAGGFSTRIIRRIAAGSVSIAAGSRVAGSSPSIVASAVSNPDASALPANLPWKLPADAAVKGRNGGAGVRGGAGAAAPPIVPPPSVPATSSNTAELVRLMERVDPHLLRTVLAGSSGAGPGGSAPMTLQEMQRGYMARHAAQAAAAQSSNEGSASGTLPRLTQ